LRVPCCRHAALLTPAPSPPAADNVDINVTSDPEMGTIYSVNIPVKRVRPQARASLKNMENAEEVADGIKFSWTDMDMDPDNKDSVQARFPYGA